ncbi:TonB-dependent receptor [Luteimonas sp. SJ-92]|uniref:TonB-dependent receptor n=1 Tax=Luteimonas salinisoli TaxID=2752307 RepID=A0A853J8D2_9GAMM|nr:TonB-dependent receptor [Luteimonas salinisoli]
MQSNYPRTALSRALGLAILGLACAPVLAQTQAETATQADTQVQQAPEPQQAQAQAPTEVTELDSIVVTGFRRSLQFSTDAKRDSTGFTDSIFAEDIGKFPDLNIAESLNRIPGIQLDRDVNGEGLNIGIRGLPQSFTKTIINGGEAATASIGLNRGNQNREVDLNLFPTEFFNQLTVYKSPQASLPEGGVSGVVDMRSARPFDNPGQHLNYSLQLDHNSIGDKISPRGSAIYSWTNDEGTFGALFGVASVRSRLSVRGWESIGWMNPSLNYQQCGLDAPDDVDPLTTRPAECNPGGGGSLQMPNTVPDNASTRGAGLTPGDTVDAAWLMAQNPGLDIGQITEALFPRLGRPVDMSGDRDRDAVISSLEWRPSDRMHFYLDSLYSRAKYQNDRIDMNLVGRTFGPVGFLPTDMQLDENGVVTSATLVNAQFFLEARPYRDEVQYWNVNPGATLWFGENEDIKLDVAGNWSRSWFFRESPTILPMSPFTTVDYTNDGSEPTWTTGGLDLNDPNAGWTWAGGRVNVNNEKRVTEAGRLRADLQLGEDRRNIKVGVAYDRFSRTINAFDNSAAWQAHVLETVSDADLASFLRPGPHGFITMDFDAFFAATNYRQFSDEAPEVNTSQSVGAAAGAVDETNFAAYVEVNGEADIWNRNLRFNAGVRWVDTDQEISGPVVLGGVRQWQSLEGGYDEWLPSFSAAWDVAEDVVLRLSSSRTMTRPNPRSMLPATTFSDPSAEIADQGNPNLSPYLSTNVDLGAEWYTGGEGMVALSLFNKRISGYTYQGINVIPFRDLGISIDDLTDNQRAALDANGGLDAPINVRQQVNADATLDIQGWEAIWVQPLDFVFDGLGFMANYTDIDLEPTGQEADELEGNLFGIAPRMWNATTYWENDVASVRLSYNWSDGFAVRARGNNEGGINYAQHRVLKRGQLDLSAGYTFSALPSSPQVTLNVINLTNKQQRSVLEYDNVTYDYYEPGRTILLGIRGTF